MNVHMPDLGAEWPVGWSEERKTRVSVHKPGVITSYMQITLWPVSSCRQVTCNVQIFVVYGRHILFFSDLASLLGSSRRGETIPGIVSPRGAGGCGFGLARGGAERADICLHSRLGPTAQGTGIVLVEKAPLCRPPPSRLAAPVRVRHEVKTL